MTNLKGPIVIVTRDNRRYGGATPEAAVAAMCNAGIFTSGKTNEEYMAGVSSRYKALDGIEIRHDTEEHFLLDLEARGLINLNPMN